MPDAGVRVDAHIDARTRASPRRFDTAMPWIAAGALLSRTYERKP